LNGRRHSRLFGFDDAGLAKDFEWKAEPTEGRYNPNRGILDLAARM